MDLKFSAEDEAYRARLKQWIRDNAAIAAGMARAPDPVQAARDWQRKLWEAGYVGLSWPREYGGQGASLTQQVIVSEELARAQLPPLINVIGLSIFGPTLILHGTEEQRAEHLPPMLRGEVGWCQGFSEPGSGSDLASLQTRAVRDGDDYVVNGQ